MNSWTPGAMQLGFMDVKGIKTDSAVEATLNRQTSLKALPRVKAEGVYSGKFSPNVQGSDVAKATAALAGSDALVSEISDQTKSITEYTNSLNGILQQGINESSDVRAQALEKEANQVYQAVRDRLVAVQNSGIKSSDPLRSEVEARIGRALDALFPDDGKDSSAVAKLSFSNKELIISVQTRILRANQYLESLTKNDSESSQVKEDVNLKAETAQINAESAQTSVTDIDAAFELARQARSAINADPAKAMNAILGNRAELNVRS